MSARTVMTTRAQPGRTPVIRMPRACEARSRSNRAAAARSARRCAPLTVSGGTPMARGPSAASEARRALLGEGRDPFGVIDAVAELALVVALDVQLLRQRTSQPLVNRLLGSREPAGRGDGQLPRQTLDHGGEFIVFDTTPDQPPGRGLRGGGLRAGQMSRGRVHVPPESGTRPSFEKACTKLAERAAITRSQASAILAPAPAATPLTAAITGSGSERSAG